MIQRYKQIRRHCESFELRKCKQTKQTKNQQDKKCCTVGRTESEHRLENLFVSLSVLSRSKSQKKSKAKQALKSNAENN